MLCETSSEVARKGDGFQAWLGRIQREFDVRSELIEQPPSPFAGAVCKHQIGRLTLLDVTGTAYSATHMRLSPPAHVNVLISLRGSTNLEQDSFRVVLRAGEYCVLDATQPSRTLIDGPFHNVVARIPVGDVQAMLPAWQESIGTVIDGRQGAGSVFFDVVRSILRQNGALEKEARAGVADAAIDLFGTTLRALPHNRRPSPSHMESFHLARIKAFVHEHLRDPDLDVETVSRSLGMSVRHIHRLFRNEPLHLMQWVWSERLRHCYAELNRESQRHRTVAQIAYDWGFNDAAHFSRTFRQRYGLAPTELRERALAG